ncbi:MAG: exodeoxyribonuclease VII large subunit [Deltaproteobacteria bacterium]|nr:exodeoxyribonuclease VII large subunit [Deltaproteobacteria bacterium]MBW2084877.1 exodeoxyribonuclease VII large subunit [Deltaproteobacteria bacterium]
MLSVSELTARLKNLIEVEFGQVWLTGEISNLRLPSSGHCYMTLKDEGAQLRAVMFRREQRYLDFEPEDGQEVLVRGRVSVYEARGEYQILIDYMEPHGEGALRLAFERLKARLAGEGLFDEERKKPLPYLPQRVALVTSPTGAAVRDFIRVARERFENIILSVYPVRVQGDGAAQEIAEAIADLNRWADFDVIVLTRGGGSLEDLWAFNEEVLARAVDASKIPVVSAVGHEIDFSISDFVADLRASTPSAAAVLIFQEKAVLKMHVNSLIQRMASASRGRLSLVQEKTAHYRTRLGDPSRWLADQRLRLDDLTEELNETVQQVFKTCHQAITEIEARLALVNPRARLETYEAKLTGLKQAFNKAGQTRLSRSRDGLYSYTARLGDLNPLAVLKRGYAVVRRRSDLVVLHSASEVYLGEKLNVLLAKGELDVTVDEVR